MNFCQALEILRKGGTVRRRGWSLMFLEMQTFDPELIYVKRDIHDSGTPWLSTQADILSDDWYNVSIEINTERKEKIGIGKVINNMDNNQIDDNQTRNASKAEAPEWNRIKVYCACYQGIKDMNDTLCIYIESNSLVNAMKTIGSLSLPRLEKMKFVGISLTDLTLLNESANLQSYEIYSIQTPDREYLCSGNGSDIIDLVIGLGLASHNIIGMTFIDEAGKYLLIKNGK